MKQEEAIRAIRKAGVTSTYWICPHARDEGKQASASRRDLDCALSNVESAVFQKENGRWRCEGPDFDGDPLTFIIAFDDGVIVVTVW